ncbi:MAG TPA: hypothetical protein DCZ10_16045 [Pelotomaculum sp.]|nr:hypothetical protein [Pelotomaculum sp.]
MSRRKKRRPQDVTELAAGYCSYHDESMSYGDICRKRCMDPVKQCRYGNSNGQCRHLHKVKLHPVWDILEAIP